jgi:hypothetical protein
MQMSSITRRMMEGKDLDQRAESDLRRLLRCRGEEDLLVGRHAQVGAMVFGEVVA